MKNNLWSVESFSEKPIHVVLLVSRKKDNQDIPDFKERRQSFITHKTIRELMDNEFLHFVQDGHFGETSRLYYSVNARDPEKIHKQLLHFLIDEPEFNLCSIQPKLAGIAAQKECALEKKWMFDFDNNDDGLASQFVKDIRKIVPEDAEVVKYKTPNGYAIVVDKHFDTRELLKEWNDKYVDVTLKRDDLLCADWWKKVPSELEDII